MAIRPLPKTPAPQPQKPAPQPQQTKPIPMVQGKVGTPQVHMQSLMKADQAVKAAQQPKTPAPAQPKQQSGKSILAQAGPITQKYGQPSQYDVFSGKKSPAFEVAVPTGTALSAPPGKWQVVQSFDQADPKGYIGNFQGEGWGNHVRLKNMDTGEVIGFNHMSQVGVKPGDVISDQGGVGLSGMSGNATGPHVAFTYQNAQGQAGDFAQTPYVNSLFGGIQQAIQQAGGAVQGAVGAAGQAGQQMMQQAGQMFSPQAGGQPMPQQQQPSYFPPIMQSPQAQPVQTSPDSQTPPPIPYMPQLPVTPPVQPGQYQGVYSPNQSMGQGGGYTPTAANSQHMSDFVATAPDKLMEAIYPQGRDQLSHLPNIPLLSGMGANPRDLGQLGASLLFDTDQQRLLRAKVLARQALTPQEHQQAMNQSSGKYMMGDLNALTSPLSAAVAQAQTQTATKPISMFGNGASAPAAAVQPPQEISNMQFLATPDQLREGPYNPSLLHEYDIPTEDVARINRSMGAMNNAGTGAKTGEDLANEALAGRQIGGVDANTPLPGQALPSISPQIQSDIDKGYRDANGVLKTPSQIRAMQDAQTPTSMGSINPSPPLSAEETSRALFKRNALIQQSGFVVGKPIHLPDGSLANVTGFDNSFTDPSGISLTLDNGKNIGFMDALKLRKAATYVSGGKL